MKNQWKTIKENWLILLIFLILVLVLSNFNFGKISLDGFGNVGENEVVRDIGGTLGTSFYGGDFAPDQDVRKIIYSASASVEVNRGDFSDAEDEFNDIVFSRNGIVLNRNVNTYGDKFERKIGYYNVRISADDLDDFLEDLKGIGDVQSFSKDASDITGSYVRLEERLRIERDKLTRLKGFLSQAESISDKIQLNDQIAQQERSVEYLQEALEGQDERIEYASVSFTISEKESQLAGIGFVTIGELVKSFVTSLAGLIKFVFIILPWAIIIWLVWFISRKFR